jgi:hypothetical protein
MIRRVSGAVTIGSIRAPAMLCPALIDLYREMVGLG